MTMSYNKAYHRFFEDYTEKRVVDEATGKARTVRVYTGWYYRHDIEDGAWRKLKVRYGLLYAAALVCFLLQGLASNANDRFFAFVIMLGIIAMVWLGFYVAAYISHQRLIGVREYRDRKTLCSAAAAAAGVNALLLAGQIAWMIQNRQFYGYGAVCILLAGVCIAAMIMLFRTEWNMEYLRVENHAEADDDSYNIRFLEQEEK